MLYFGNTGTSCQKNAKALHTTTTTNYISSLKKEIDCLKYTRTRFCLTIIFCIKTEYRIPKALFLYLVQVYSLFLVLWIDTKTVKLELEKA